MANTNEPKCSCGAPAVHHVAVPVAPWWVRLCAACWEKREDVE